MDKSLGNPGMHLWKNPGGIPEDLGGVPDGIPEKVSKGIPGIILEGTPGGIPGSLEDARM